MKTLIISDLHLGNGGPYDSFAGDQELPRLLDGYARPDTTIFVNGDGVDFLMNEGRLELDVQDAVAQARAIASHPGTQGVLHAFGRALAAGAAVVIRLGNHDLELALPAVQQVFRGALGQPAAIADRLVFQLGDQPAIMTVGGARVLVSHGEQNDPWNRVDDWAGLQAGSKKFKFAPGSELVKKLLNPLTRDHKLKFVNLLKPDFQGATLAALGVAPAAMKVLLQGASLKIMWHLFRKMDGQVAFDPNAEEEAELGLAARVDEAGLTAEERASIEEFLGDDSVSFSADDGLGRIDGAGRKLARAGLQLYAAFHRGVTGKAGDEFFTLDPTADEWKEAKRLADKFRVGAVVIGHTHAARWGQREGVVFVNSGTWIWLMKLPPSDASDEQWGEYLAELRANPMLEPSRQKLARTEARFTAVELAPAAGANGGASISLVEWVPGTGLKTLGSTTVPAA